MRKSTFIRVLVLAGCFATGLAFMATTASAQIAVGISVRVAPPEIPVYVQPPCPTDGYLWTPGHWHKTNNPASTNSRRSGTAVARKPEFPEAPRAPKSPPRFAPKQ